ncbi:MAG: 2-oxoacid:acceptor oxidoreductase family protein [Candidatus Gastranaerophilales bacterium]|nr:2-oxoacid:acceptor oxidoreductase family protein [Candidatus Gastranaerophilales bacterium]
MNKSFLISGSGGQGILSMGTILANLFMLNDLFVTYCSSYGAEMRGGAVNCQINVSDKEINCLQNEKVDYVVALNQTSLDKFISKVKKNGTIIINSSLAKIIKTREDIKYIIAPLTQEAIKLGNIKMTNSVALGMLAKLIGGFSTENLKKVYEKILHGKSELIEKNIEAFIFGFKHLKEEIQ